VRRQTPHLNLETPAPLRLRLLPLAVAAVVATTIIPLKLRWPSLAYLDTSINRSDVINNLLLYLPLGVSLAASTAARCAGAAAGLSVLAEVLQFGYVNRDPSPVDVLANVSGAVGGYLLGRLLHRWTGYSFKTITIHRRVAACCVFIAAVSILGLAWHRTKSDFSNWDPSFQFAIGNEITGDRPWHGELEALAIYAAALPAAFIRQTAAAGPSHLDSPADVPPYGAILSWRSINNPRDCSRSLHLPENNRAFVTTLQRSGQMTILAWIVPANVDQTGPARIVTDSRDIFHRNFMLGQMARSLTFRLRTPNTGPNGTNPALFTPPLLVAGKQSFVAITYDGWVSRAYVDGKLVAHASLGARRPRFPRMVLALLPPLLPLPELELNISEFVIGSLAAIGLLGLLRGSNWTSAFHWVLALLAGSVSGLLIWILCASEPSLGLRILLLGSLGGLVIPFATEPPRLDG
jgi:VanZ family protein